MTTPGAGPPRIQRCLEDHRAGRLVISVLVTALVLTMAVMNVPTQFTAVDPLRPAAAHVTKAFGLYQEWSVFAPPRNEVLELEARVELVNGRTVVWHPPRNNALVGAYRDYHWQKYVEHAALRGNVDSWPRLWEPLARYVADETRSDGQVPVRVTLVTHTTPNLPLVGHGPTRGSERTNVYYTLDLERPRSGS